MHWAKVRLSLNVPVITGASILHASNIDQSKKATTAVTVVSASNPACLPSAAKMPQQPARQKCELNRTC